MSLSCALAWYCPPINNLFLYSSGFLSVGEVGPWILFPACFVFMPSVEGTWRKGFLRAIGTIVAFGVGIGCAYLYPINDSLYVCVLVLSMLIVAFHGITSSRQFTNFGIFDANYGYVYIIAIFTTFLIAFQGKSPGGSWRGPTARLVSQFIGSRNFLQIRSIFEKYFLKPIQITPISSIFSKFH